jgi:hypothetical protein
MLRISLPLEGDYENICGRCNSLFPGLVIKAIPDIETHLLGRKSWIIKAVGPFVLEY